MQVAGLTPHCPLAGSGPETSAVWKIVDEWNRGTDDDGVLFREKVYAVFPGFEPNVDDGASGGHLLFLFDPEIGRDRFLAIYEAIMDGRVPWEHSALRLTPRDANEIFVTLDQRQSESNATDAPWSYIALAPHFQRSHGVFHEMRSEVLERFPCRLLAGYELGDDKLPQEVELRRKPGRFLLPFMEAHRQAFFHASDAYTIPELGQRYTWMKLASPRIEALRQAFIASDARMRIGFERSEDGGLIPIGDAPDVTLNNRPWLEEVEIRGSASFFRVLSEVDREFDGRIRGRRIDNGVVTPLDAFLRTLKQKGITRWWNDLAKDWKPSPGRLTELLDRDLSKRQYWRRTFEGSGAPEQSSADTAPDIFQVPLGEVGMSDAVQRTFLESITRSKQRELAALRCPDRYFLELRMDDGSYRRLDELSGGQRVSVLLSLLLETDDSRPLVIDQPEDELDNRFLFETVLPTLKKLKGRRQVIVATHNPNVVVNGDADMVIQLEATANRGRVGCSGAIEDSAVRDAIVRTVDGGEEAFRLRRRKYGF